VAASVSNFTGAAQTLSKITNAQFLHLEISGDASSNKTFISRVLANTVFGFDLNGNGSKTDDTFRFLGGTLLGGETVGSAFLVGLDFYLSAPVVGSLPPLSVSVMSNAQALMTVSLVNLTFINNTVNHRAVIRVLLNAPQVTSAVNNVFEGQALPFTFRGTNLGGGNVLQRILDQWSLTMNFDLSNNSNAVAGGVMPDVDLTLINTTTTTAWANLSLSLDIPWDFYIDVGNVYAEGRYQGSAVVSVWIDKLHVTRGKLELKPLVKIVRSAVPASTSPLEVFLGKYLFQSVTIPISIVANITPNAALNQQNWQTPIVAVYNTQLPPQAGGNDTGVIQCTDSVMDNKGVNWFPPGCSVDIREYIYIHNPIPWFPLTIRDIYFQVRKKEGKQRTIEIYLFFSHSLYHKVFYDNPNGACYVFCAYDPAYHVKFDDVSEPGPYPVVSLSCVFFFLFFFL
jgi:hypothetical protein